MKIAEAKDLIIAHLRDYWKSGLIDTRFKVICYLVGYYGSVSETFTEAVKLLAAEGYIKE